MSARKLKRRGVGEYHRWAIGPGRVEGVTALPGFVESLRLLCSRERYALVDIAAMFGVSRERMRQLCIRYDIQHPDQPHMGRGVRAVERRWDDEHHCFQPVSRGLLRRQRAARMTQQRLRQEDATRTARRQHVLAVLTQLREQLGREPGWSEIWAALGGRDAKQNAHCMLVLGYWGTLGKPSTRERLAEFKRLTGLKPLPRGGQAHYARRSA